jgi:hypothetical protein
VGHGQGSPAEREPAPGALAEVLAFAEHTVADADSLLPGEAALVLRRGTQQQEGKQEGDDASGDRDLLHEKSVAINVAVVNLSFG